MEDRINLGLLHLKCPYCKNELSVIFGSLFGKNLKKIKESKIKYVSGCSFDFNRDTFYCDKCKKYFDKNLNENHL